MNYKIAKNLYDVPYPYTMKNAVDFIRSSHSDFNSFNAIHFAIEYKAVNSSLPFVGVIGFKGIDLSPFTNGLNNDMIIKNHIVTSLFLFLIVSVSMTSLNVRSRE